jgi:hypothetical protein
MATDSTDGPTTTSGLVDAEASDVIPTSVSATAVSGSAVPVDIAGAEGMDIASQPDATIQLTQASAIALIPKAGEWVVVRVESGDEISLAFTLAGARGLLRDGNIELRLQSGGVLVLQGYLAAIQGELPLQLTDANGESVDLEDFIVAIDELEDFDELALLDVLDLSKIGREDLGEKGPLGGAKFPVHDGGASFSKMQPIAFVEGLDETGALLATALSYGVPAIEGP